MNYCQVLLAIRLPARVENPIEDRCAANYANDIGRTAAARENSGAAYEAGRFRIGTRGAVSKTNHGELPLVL